MNELEKLLKLFNKYKKSNHVNFNPRQTLSVKINNINYYVCLMCNNNFETQVVLLDENNNLIQNILKTEGKTEITKLQNKLYIFKDDYAYIYDINNLKDNPKQIFLGDFDIQGICSNEKNIFAYSIKKDNIIEYDQDLNIIEIYKNPYSKENARVSLNLACNKEKFFSIPIMSVEKEQYFLMKNYMYNIKKDLVEQNDLIHSCTFNYDGNTLYISMCNVIWIIKDGNEFSYLHFKNSNITTVFYDNDIKKLIINLVEIKNNQFNGNIIKLTDDEINRNSIQISNDHKMFEYSENLICDKNLNKTRH